MLEDESTAGQTFELYGPQEYSMAELAELVDREIIKRRRRVNVPKFLLKPGVELASRLVWFIEMCGDHVERQFLDQAIDRSAKTFKDLGIEPADVKDWTYAYLVRTLPLLAPLPACQALADYTFPQPVRLPCCKLHGLAAHDRAGKARREEVFTRYR